MVDETAAAAEQPEHGDWYDKLMARFDALEKQRAPRAPRLGVLWQSDRPWWAPDAQGFVIGAVVIYVGVVLFYRMTHASEVNDKLLDMMLTILFGTAFVGVVNYLVGSSRGSAAKDEVQTKLVDKLTDGTKP